VPILRAGLRSSCQVPVGKPGAGRIGVRVGGQGRGTSVGGQQKMLDADGGRRICGVRLARESTINLAVIEELGEHVLYFRLQAWVDGVWKEIYRGNKIQRYRLCGFEPVTTDRLRLVIEEMREGEPVRIKSIALYNEPKRDAEGFEVAAYTHLKGRWNDTRPSLHHLRFSEIVARGEADAYARYYDVYNTVILFQSVYFNDDGDMLYDGGEEFFARELAALKEVIARRTNPHEVKLILDLLSNGADFGSLGVNGLMPLHWEKIADQAIAFLMKYDLDGLAIDWEFPETEDEWRIHDSFVARLDDGLKAAKPGATLSGAFFPHAMGDMSLETAARFDRIQYMAYDDNDRDGFNSSLGTAQGGVASIVRRKNVDVGKINIGIGMYCNVKRYTPWKDQPGTNYWDCKYYNESTGGYLGFCSPALAGDKVTYALLTGAGGVMVWCFEHDLPMDDPASITGGMEDALKRYTANW